ncbi:hypothetical protein Tco_0927571 [Tanacetum coccineum]
MTPHHAPICSFHQAIGLWVLDGGKALADAQLFTPIFEWVVPELLFVTRYYFPWSLREGSGYVNSPFVKWPYGHDGILESSFLHLHALLASSIMSV